MSSSPKQETAELEPTTAVIIKELPRFRILVIGKSGAGKTSLIEKTFNVPKDELNNPALKAGQSDINKELTSQSNDRFILHDSMGFEPGEVENFAKVKAFIAERQSMPDLKDRLHAIWLCVATPSAGGRSFETGDEEFLRLNLRDVPVIMVFTKYDILVSEVERTMDTDDDSVCRTEAGRKFEETCGEKLREVMKDVKPPHPHVQVSVRYSETLELLVQSTQTAIGAKNPTFPGVGVPCSPSKLHPMASTVSMGLGHASGYSSPDPTEVVRLAWAMAQRVSPALKIQASIAIGKKKYWRGISSSSDSKLAHLEAIHADIIKVWNFNDPQSLLTNNGTFKSQIFAEIKKLGAYDTSTFVIQSLMGYIVDLTIIMHNLSGTLHAATSLVTADILQQALQTYYRPPGGTSMQVHRDIKAYIMNSKANQDDPALREVIRLIKHYCAPTIVAQASGDHSQPPSHGLHIQDAQVSGGADCGQSLLRSVETPNPMSATTYGAGLVQATDIGDKRHRSVRRWFMDLFS